MDHERTKSSGMRNALLLISILSLSVAGLLWLGQVPKESGVAELHSLGVIAIPEPRELSDHALFDQSGNRFDLRRLNGHWSFIFFGYTRCPDICPVTMSILGQAERLIENRQGGNNLADGFQGILVSVDPERDDEGVLGAYVTAFSPAFIGLTGTGSAVKSFGLQLGIGYRKGEPIDSEIGYLIDHSPYIVVVDPAARHYGYIKPPFDAGRIALIYSKLRQIQVAS